MAISKGKRFEVFKRDGFTCQYCGRRPPDVILEVDHIDPRCSGGSDDDINLITSCWDCNRGKGRKALGEVRPRPDADMEYLKVQQELAEAQRYLTASRKLDSSRRRIVKHLEEIWREVVSSEYVPTTRQWKTWLSQNDPDRIEYALRITGAKFHVGQFGHGHSGINQAIRYASGVMVNLRKRDEEAIQ